MDPRHLEPTEVIIECQVRQIEVDDPYAMDHLIKRIELERTDPSCRPVVMHKTRSNSSEIADCRSLMESLQNDIGTAVRETNPDHLVVCYSRLCHIIGRVERLCFAAKNMPAARRLIEELLVLRNNFHGSPSGSSKDQSIRQEGEQQEAVNSNRTANSIMGSAAVQPAPGLPLLTVSAETPASNSQASTETAQNSKSGNSRRSRKNKSNQLFPENTALTPRQIQLLQWDALYSAGLSGVGPLAPSLAPPIHQNSSMLMATAFTQPSNLNPYLSANALHASMAELNIGQHQHPQQPSFHEPFQNVRAPQNVRSGSLAVNSGGLPSVDDSINVNPFRPPASYPPQFNSSNTSVPRMEPPRPEYVAPRVNPVSRSSMDKWTLKFAGSSQDIPIDDFIFRVESLATAAQLNHGDIVLGLHFILRDTASDWYWTYRRKHPDALWPALRAAMITQYEREFTDLQLRRAMMNRRQRNTEKFADFCLVIESMSVRLRRAFDEVELVDLLKQNMSSRLQEATLMHDLPTVSDLQRCCKRFELLWERSGPRTVHELDTSDTDLYEPEIAAFRGDRNATQAPRATLIDRSNYLICWNCDEMGHSYQDCTSTIRAVFCYGCGAKRTYKPTCQRCNIGRSENRQQGVTWTGVSRPNPNSGHTQSAQRTTTLSAPQVVQQTYRATNPDQIQPASILRRPSTPAEELQSQN